MIGQNRTKRSGMGGWLFLGIVLLIYGATMLIDLSLAKQSIVFFSQMLEKIIPVLALVFLLIFLFDLFLTPRRVERYIGTSSGLKGWLLAIMMGILSTGPIYAWYIVLSELKQKGMKTSLAAVFLYSRAIKLPLLPLLVHYFGLRYTLVLSLYLLGFAVINGLLFETLDKRRTFID